MPYAAMIAAFLSGFAASVVGVAIGALISYRLMGGRAPVRLPSGKAVSPPALEEEPVTPLRFERKL